MRKTNLPLLLLFLLSTSCYKDVDNSTEIIKESPPHIVVDGDLVGDFAYIDGSGSDQFSLKIRGQTYQARGSELPPVQLNKVYKRGELVEFYRNGILAGASQVGLIENEVNYKQFLVESSFEQEGFNNSKTLEFENDLSLTIDGSGLSLIDGGPYEGRAIITYHNSSNKEYNENLSNFAYDHSGNLSIVDPIQSFYIALESDDGEKLQISDGEILIKDGQAEGKHIYHYNEANAIWQWVSSFSAGVNTEKIVDTGLFILGGSSEAVYVEGEVLLTDLPISKQKLFISSEGFQRELQSTSSGHFGSFVPKSSRLLVEVRDRNDQNLYSEEVDQNSFGNLLKVELPSEVLSSKFLTTDFEVIDCEGKIKEQRSISLDYTGGQSERFVLSRIEPSLLPIASENFQIRSGEGPAFEWNELTQDIHYLSECTDHEQGFTLIKIRNDQKLFPAFLKEQSNDKTVLNAVQNEVRLIIEADAKGLYTNDMVNISIDDMTFGDQGYFVSCENAEQGCGIEVCEITHFKDDGDEWNRVFFKGKIWMQTISPPQAGNFDVEGYILSKQ
jgi:hypothetical protein